MKNNKLLLRDNEQSIIDSVKKRSCESIMVFKVVDLFRFHSGAIWNYFTFSFFRGFEKGIEWWVQEAPNNFFPEMVRSGNKLWAYSLDRKNFSH